MSTDLERLRTALGRLLPLRSGPLQAQLSTSDPPVEVDETGALRITLVIVLRDESDDSVLDAREQQLHLGEFASHPVDRWLAYIEGTLRAAPAIVEQLGVDPTSILPGDLFSDWELLVDPTLRSADDFTAALRDRDRLAALNRKRTDELWHDQLAPCGLADRSDAVRALLRPALRLELEPADDPDEFTDDEDPEQTIPSPRPLGETRVGGHPDLPPDLPWPEAHGRPLLFVAQFDLAELRQHRGAHELPDHGLLTFFYDPDGTHDTLAHTVRVLHFADPTLLAPRPTPATLTPLPIHTLRVHAERQLPGLTSEFFYHSLLPADRVLPYYERLAAHDGSHPPIDPDALHRLLRDMSEHDPTRPIHQLLGHPDSIQGDPYLDVEMTTHPGGWDDWREGTAKAHQLRTAALRWRLLLQIDATQDDELLLNQDGGYFYFWIPDDALASHDWTRARGSLQCH